MTYKKHLPKGAVSVTVKNVVSEIVTRPKSKAAGAIRISGGNNLSCSSIS